MKANQLKELDWVKRWSEPVTPLLCSYIGEQYLASVRDKFGIGFNHILFYFKDEMAICYRLESDTDAIGIKLAEAFEQDSNLAIKWCKVLEEQTGQLIHLIEQKPELFLQKNKFYELDRKLDSYLPIFIRVNIVPDYLSSELLNKSKADLQKIRLETENVYIRINDLLCKITSLIADKENRESDKLKRLFADELRDYVESNKLPNDQDLDGRTGTFGLYVNHDGLYELTQSQVNELEGHIVDAKITNSNSISGQVACKGKTSGLVRVILNPRETADFNQGDVLITGMTNPEFVPLMQKAGAVVTDAGGILSHAAIASRELNKPCIIGTHVATKVFKDGDMVEVDAENGIIKKVKTSK